MKFTIRKCLTILILLSHQYCCSALNISLFQGNNYQTGNQQALTLRFDQGNAWKYGDNFFFFDITNPDQNGTSIYGEWQPRLSFSKLTGHKISFGPVSDVLLASELNVNGADGRVYLYGLGVNLNIPTFAFIKLNTYVRDDPKLASKTYQISVVWSEPFKINDRVLIDFAGFIDDAGKEDTKSANFLAKPRLMLDLGQLLWQSPKNLLVGIQYVYWHNKLGIHGLTESLPEAMLTWTF